MPSVELVEMLYSLPSLVNEVSLMNEARILRLQCLVLCTCTWLCIPLTWLIWHLCTIFQFLCSVFSASLLDMYLLVRAIQRVSFCVSLLVCACVCIFYADCSHSHWHRSRQNSVRTAQCSHIRCWGPYWIHSRRCVWCTAKLEGEQGTNTCAQHLLLWCAWHDTTLWCYYVILHVSYASCRLGSTGVLCCGYLGHSCALLFKVISC